MQTNIIEQKLQTAYLSVFTSDIQSVLPSMILEAQDLCNEAYATVFLLKETKLSKDIRAHILRIAIGIVAKKYCDKGLLPWSYSIELNSAKNCRHTEMKFGAATIYFAKTRSPLIKPQAAKYRPDVEINPFTEKVPPIDTFLITYGETKNGTIFSSIGIPGEESWLYVKPLDMKRNATVNNQEENKKALLVKLIDEYKAGADNYDTQQA